ncbi:unnamed protein product [Cochlearia groenlandica]
MASSSSPSPPQMKDQERRNWAELPSELLVLIMLSLTPFEILENAQKVCRSWRRVSKDPSLWRKIDIRNHKGNRRCVDGMCRQAVDRSQGDLVEIHIGKYGSDDLMEYIAHRSSNLRRLVFESLYGMTRKGLVKALAKLPSLEEIHFKSSPFMRLDLNAIGHSCPNLKSLKINCSRHGSYQYKNDDQDALEIAETMHQLRHLQLLANRLTNKGLNAILDNCPYLEHLDLRQCLNLNFSGDLEMRCLERIKCLRYPEDSVDDYPQKKMASSSSSPHPQIKDDERINWSELPTELLTLIMLLLSPFEILENAQKVCRSWRRVSKNPSLWRVIDMQFRRGGMKMTDGMCRQDFDRSQGGLVELDFGNNANDNLLNYMAERSSNLRSLSFGSILRTTCQVLVKTISKLPSLEKLEFFFLMNRLDLKTIGLARPNLKSLKLNCSEYLVFHPFGSIYDNNDAIYISEHMRGLRHLELLGNRLTNKGLIAILEKCLKLEHLDLRQCLNLNFTEELEKRCLESIKFVRPPNDLTDDSPYHVYFNENWAELPSELLTLIMLLLSPYCILENAQKVCRSWRRVSMEPSLWRVIDMRSLRKDCIYTLYIRNVCRRAVDRSEGGLVEINIGEFGTDELLSYIADRSSNLRRLVLERFHEITNNCFVNQLAKLPLLEELNFLPSCKPRLNLKAIGHSCPNLKTLKLNFSFLKRSEYKTDDDDALAIAESMHGLRHLQLLANRITDVGLKAILDNCPHLEHLDLRQCLNLQFSGDLENRCLEKIKCVRRPSDSTHDFLPFVSFTVPNSSGSYFDDIWLR